MTHEQALELTNLLVKIQRTSKLIAPLVEEGKDAFKRFTEQLNEILSNIFPTYTVAFAGPVNSGKSTLLSSLIQETGENAIAASGPSNETFAPMTISHGNAPSLLVYYFSAKVLEQIEERLTDLENAGGAKHEIAMYKELKKTLKQIGPVTATNREEGVIRRIDLIGKNKSEVIKVIRSQIAQSSNNRDVYGVYKVELEYPGEKLKELNNARFVDLFGFGEPNPIVGMKYDRFLSEQTIDAIVYVFPDRAVSADFNRLFEIDSFLEEIVAKQRLFIVLNKADAYPDAKPSQWDQVAKDFRATLAKHVPILKNRIGEIPIFVLSAESIDGKINSTNGQAVRARSLDALHALRDKLREVSRKFQNTSTDPSVYLGTIFDLLGTLDLLVKEAHTGLSGLEFKLPKIERLLDSISQNEESFVKRRPEILGAFRNSLEDELMGHLHAVDYERELPIDVTGIDDGDPQKLFRWMVEAAQNAISHMYRTRISKIFKDLTAFIDDRLLAAYRQYVSMQDDAIQKEFEESSSQGGKTLARLTATVDFSARDLLGFAAGMSQTQARRRLLERFADWYLRKRCVSNADRGQSAVEIKAQIVKNVRDTLEAFMLAYVCEDPKVAGLVHQICIAGEETFWKQVKVRVEKLDQILATQIRVTKYRIGLYQDKVFFLSNQKEFRKYVTDVMQTKDAVQSLAVELA